MSAPVKSLPVEDLEHVLAHTRQLWAGARGANFFITGGTGFFGRWLLESFVRANDALALGMRATVLTRDPAALARRAPHLAARGDLVFHQGDLGDFAFPAGRFDYLVHAAADTSIWTKNQAPEGLLELMATHTRQVLDFAAGAGVRQFLYVSSGAVYGPQPEAQTHIPEDGGGTAGSIPPDTLWGEAKRLAEQLCLDHARKHGYAVKIARCFSFVGPHLPLDSSYAIGNFIRDALRGEPIRVSGDGTAVRSYLYAADLALWLWTILFRGPSASVYNVGSDVPESIAAHAQHVSKATGGNSPVRIAKAPDPAGRMSRYVPLIDRARVELGLGVRISEAEGIRRTLEWHGGVPMGVCKR
jgi:dTDP-glucose 4,6-dehydratase